MAPARPPAPSTLNGQTGYDISWPQCGLASPGQPYSVAVVGVTGGRPFTSNPCLDSQWQWAGAGGSGAAVYMNTSNPSPAGAYAWGVSSAQDALARAASAGVRSPMWWLDVEFGNAWSSDRNANAQAVQGAIDALRGSGVQVGVYSTSYQWGVIVGGYAPGVPIWVAGAPWGAAASWCSGHGFGGGPTWMVQSVDRQAELDDRIGRQRPLRRTRDVHPRRVRRNRGGAIDSGRSELLAPLRATARVECHPDLIVGPLEGAAQVPEAVPGQHTV